MRNCLVIFAAALLLGVLWRDAEWGRWWSKELTIFVLDVGQGDAILINGPEKQILIDGGPDALVVERLGEVLPWWDRSLDAVVNTHPDADHLMGLIDVVERFNVSAVYETGQIKTSPAYKEWIQEVSTRQKIVRLNDEIDLGGGALLRVVGPTIDVSGQLLTEPNDASIFFTLVYGDFSMLFTGDASFVQENQLLEAGTLSDVDVLKVGHHGSASSTGESFLDVVQPEVAVIPVGVENDYGHPRLEVLLRLENRNVTTYRTDRQGTVRIMSDGEGYEVNTRRKP